MTYIATIFLHILTVYAANTILWIIIINYIQQQITLISMDYNDIGNIIKLLLLYWLFYIYIIVIIITDEFAHVQVLYGNYVSDTILH